MAVMSKNKKIMEAINQIETMTRTQYMTGAIMGSNTNTITAVQLLKSAITAEGAQRKPRERKTQVVPKDKWKFPLNANKKTPAQTDIPLEQTKD